MAILNSYKIAALFTIGIFVAGCTSNVTTSAQYSGFINDYSKLQEAESASGQKVLRWVSPILMLRNTPVFIIRHWSIIQVLHLLIE